MEKIYDKIKLYLAKEKITKHSPFFIENQDIIENINTNILNLSILNNQLFLQIGQSLSNFQFSLDDYPHELYQLHSSMI